MQLLTNVKRRPGRGRVARGQVEELNRSWNVLARFILNRKLQSSVYHGVGADLSARQLQALYALDEGPRRMGELAALLGLAESSATRLINRLVTAGLVDRRPSEQDRRSIVVELAEEGIALVAALHDERRSLLVEVLGALDAPERVQFVSLFGRIAEVIRDREAAASDRGRA